jgi:predicted Zn-dependent protease
MLCDMASKIQRNDKPVEPPDVHFLNAAQGWLELGNPAEASQELGLISPAFQGHPDVLEVKWDINAKQSQWEIAFETACDLLQAAPNRSSGWIQRSFALHELKRTAEAYEMLLPAITRFGAVHIIPYNLACYCCQLDRLDEARQWLGGAIEIAGLTRIQKMSMQDLDLAPLWSEILSWKNS